MKTPLDEECVRFLPLSAQISGKNSIYNAWAILKRNLRQESTYLTSKADLFEELFELRNYLPSEYFERVFASISRSVLELSMVRGLSIKY